MTAPDPAVDTVPADQATGAAGEPTRQLPSFADESDHAYWTYLQLHRPAELPAEACRFDSSQESR